MEKIDKSNDFIIFSSHPSVSIERKSMWLTEYFTSTDPSLIVGIFIMLLPSFLGFESSISNLSLC